jgi:myo-inositol-hexaphosphate 3-phosphohydrolase
MSTNALAGVRGTVKESKQAIADFKLRMSCEGVVADKEVGKKG